MPNRLATETSPYLRQHADNPVDWYPWGAAAFAAAVEADKPILLSVGYAACHWCHVMAHESFEDDETAALMNALFINVKVDREERPDVDAIYMQAVQAMVGQGGWPMTVVLTPDGVPYWGGTYFPREPRPGIPSFKRVLETVAAAWRDKRDAVEKTTQAMRELYANASLPGTASGDLSPELLERAFHQLTRRFDETHGGFEGAPKFPQVMALDFCLRWYARSGNAEALRIAQTSFLKMSRGGICDQVGGGFHRYTVDGEWLVPHFEKMLYDNALLVRLGVHLWQVTGDTDIRRVTEDTMRWLAREMTSPEGGFYSSLDADSEGHEGKFYIWDTAELDDVLGTDSKIAKSLWHVQRGGNFEGMSILHEPRDRDVVAVELGLSLAELDARASSIRERLYVVRSKRVWPGLDDKVLASWNGLMTRALADAASAFASDEWRDLAVKNGEFLRTHLVNDGRVTRVYAAGSAKGPGFLEDHAAVALAFHALHELTRDPQWLTDADRIATVMEARFLDTSSGTWYDTASDAEPLITRPRDHFDNATPAGTSLALELMLRLAELRGDQTRSLAVIAQLATVAEPMAKYPGGFGHILGVTDMALFGAIAVGLVGDPLATEPLARVINARYLPTVVVASAPNGEAPVPLLRDRPGASGVGTAYVCRGFVCKLPTSDPVELASQLDLYRSVTAPS
jgi:uncharacterized protein YyaL (SSP411 family)